MLLVSSGLLLCRLVDIYPPLASSTLVNICSLSMMNIDQNIVIDRDSKSEEEREDYVDDEAALMKELKDLYNKKETQSVSASSSVSQLSKKLKECAAEKLELESTSLKQKQVHVIRYINFYL